MAREKPKMRLLMSTKKVQRDETFAGRSKGGSISGGIGRPMMVNTDDATLPM